MNYEIGAENLFRNIASGLKYFFIPHKKNSFRPALLQSNFLLAVVVVLLVVKIITIGLGVPFPKNIFFADITKTDLVNILNQDRTQEGLKPLTENLALDQAAFLKAQDMVQKKYFAHQSPEGKTPWFWFLQAGYHYHYAGENLAIGFVDSTQVFDAWLASPSHKENILNQNYQEVGTAVVPGFGSNNDMVVVQLFGSPQLVKPIVVSGKIPVAPTPKTPVDEMLPKPEPILPTTPNPTTPVNQDINQNLIPEKVLGQSVQLNQLSKSKTSLQNTAYTNAIHFMVYDYQNLAMYVSYGMLWLVTFLLAMMVVFNNHKVQPKTVVRGLTMLAIIWLTLMINKETLGHMISSHITIF